MGVLPEGLPDGATLIYSFDSPKYGYQVDMAIWSMPLNGTQAQARRRTTPNDHTGGDVTPIPLAGGGLLFVRHSIEASTAVTSQIYYQSRPFAIPKALTSEADDCSQPALSPDGTQLAMICTGGKQTAKLEVAPFTGNALGPAKVLLDGRLFAAPAWSPDGKALAYFAPAGAAGHFQLWYLALPAVAPSASASTSATPSVGTTPTVRASASPAPTQPIPVQVTQGVDLSATSAPAWF